MQTNFFDEIFTGENCKRRWSKQELEGESSNSKGSRKDLRGRSETSNSSHSKKVSKYKKGKTREKLVESCELRADKTVKAAANQKCDQWMLSITSDELHASEAMGYSIFYPYRGMDIKFQAL